MKPNEIASEPAAVLALAELVSPSLNGASSFLLAAWLEAVDADLDLAGLPELDPVSSATDRLSVDRVSFWKRQLMSDDLRVVTVVDDSYPANLRMIHDHPPFLFARGTLCDEDERAIAVVGTRRPSRDGVEAASRLGAALAGRGITVVSGLAAGIDTAAHVGALNASGRTLAVLGTGIEHVYPAANRMLAEKIPSAGALLSQFWPDMRGTRWSFPVRNIVTSGLSLGTVVIEAGPTSGARQQAEHALRHGKRLYLLQRLIDDQTWAGDLIGTSGVIVIDEIDQILETIDLELDLHADILV